MGKQGNWGTENRVAQPT